MHSIIQPPPLSRCKTFPVPPKVTLCPFSSQSPIPTGNYGSVLCPYNIAFARMLCYKWNRTVCGLVWLASFNWHDNFWDSSMWSCVSISCPFLSEWYSIIWIYHSLLIHSPADGHLGDFCLLWKKLWWTFAYQSWHGYMLSFLLDKCVMLALFCSLLHP